MKLSCAEPGWNLSVKLRNWWNCIQKLSDLKKKKKTPQTKTRANNQPPKPTKQTKKTNQPKTTKGRLDVQRQSSLPIVKSNNNLYKSIVFIFFPLQKSDLACNFMILIFMTETRIRVSMQKYYFF